MGVSIFTTSDQYVGEYYESPRLNQSHLKTFLVPDGYKVDPKEEDEELMPMQVLIKSYSEPRNLILGDYVDGYLTREEGYLERKYFYDPIPEKPSENIQLIIKYYYENVSGENLSLKGPLIKVARDMGYRNNYSDDKLYETIVKEGQVYFSYLKHAEGKIILDKKDFDLLQQMLNKIEESTYTRNILKEPWKFFGKEEENPDFYYEVRFQKIIYFEFDGIECKALIDILIVERDLVTMEVTGTYLIDLKTTGEAVFKFNNSVDKFRYDFQLGFYAIAVSKLYNIQLEKVRCGFLVVPKVNKNIPMVHLKVTSDLLYRGIHGECPLPSPMKMTQWKSVNEFRTPKLGITEAIGYYKASLENPNDSPMIRIYGTEYEISSMGIL